ncbi:MAG: hypothetical protein BGO95_04825 [Micrococcales bacterium 73-13]|nr:MAG: hypothetical protein BGO95_04825 [Micrococcales bacterium 73-13]
MNDIEHPAPAEPEEPTGAAPQPVAPDQAASEQAVAADHQAPIAPAAANPDAMAPIAMAPIATDPAVAPAATAPAAPVAPPTPPVPPMPPAPAGGYQAPSGGHHAPAGGHASTSYASAPAAAAVPAAALAAPPRRRGWVPVVGALAAGAVFGAAAGAGTAVLVTHSEGSGTVPLSASPQTITVNDTASVNAITAVAASAMDSVVTLSVADSAIGAGTGSGVVIDDQGHIVTNTHVVTLGGQTANPTIKVTTSSGRVYSGTVVGTDPLLDLAVVQVTDATGLVPIEFADSSDLNVGDLTVAIGAPLGLSGTVTSGIVSALDRSIQVASSAVPDSSSDSGSQGQSPFGNFRFDLPGVSTPSAKSYIQLPVIQTDTAINPGNSGGALLDANGRLIGINVAIAGDTGGNIGVGFAIPSNVVRRVSSEIVESGSATHGLLGVTVVDVAQDPSQSNAGIVGASVQQVVSGGGAAAAGIQVGDIIVSVDGIPITSRNDLTAQIRTYGVGDVVDVVFVRSGQTKTVQVTLGDLKDLPQ